MKGVVAGGGALALLMAAGLLLYQRLWQGSLPILILVRVVFGAAGGYGGWLLGVLVFSAARGDREDG